MSQNLPLSTGWQLNCFPTTDWQLMMEKKNFFLCFNLETGPTVWYIHAKWQQSNYKMQLETIETSMWQEMICPKKEEKVLSLWSHAQSCFPRQKKERVASWWKSYEEKNGREKKSEKKQMAQKCLWCFRESYAMSLKRRRRRNKKEILQRWKLPHYAERKDQNARLYPVDSQNSNAFEIVLEEAALHLNIQTDRDLVPSSRPAIVADCMATAHTHGLVLVHLWAVVALAAIIVIAGHLP